MHVIPIVGTVPSESLCRYVSIMKALQTLGDDEHGRSLCSVESLRASVALEATSDMLHQYQADRLNGLTHTEFMEDISCLVPTLPLPRI